MGIAPNASVQNGEEERDWPVVLNVKKGQVVQELGWDEDADSRISEALEEELGEHLLEEDTLEIVDVVLLWWREEDGDLVDGLITANRSLDEDGYIWLLTPAPEHPGSIEPGVVAESAQLAGMVQTSSERLGDWQGACLVASGAQR